MEMNGDQRVLGGAQAGGVAYVFCLHCTPPSASTEYTYKLEVADMNGRAWAAMFTHEDLARLLRVQGLVFEEQEAVQASVRESLQAHVELHFAGSSLYMTSQGTGELEGVMLRFPPCTPNDTPLAMHELLSTEGKKVCSDLAFTMLAQLQQLQADLATTRQSERSAWGRAHNIQATADAAIAALKRQAGLDMDLNLPGPSQAHAAATYMPSQQQQPQAKRSRTAEPTQQPYGTQHMADMARSSSQPRGSQRPSGGSAAPSPAKGAAAVPGGALLRHASSGIERVLGAYNAVRVGSESLSDMGGSQGAGPSSQGLAAGAGGNGMAAPGVEGAHDEGVPAVESSSSDDDLPPMPENIGRKVVPRAGLHQAARGRGRGRGGRKATAIG